MLEHGSITVRLGRVSCRTNGEHCASNVVITWGNPVSMLRVLKQKLSRIDEKREGLTEAIVLDARVMPWHNEVSKRRLYEWPCKLSSGPASSSSSSSSNSTELNLLN